jgi:hypothetical protein
LLRERADTPHSQGAHDSQCTVSDVIIAVTEGCGKADRAARLEAELVIDRWNRRLATGRDVLWSPTIRAAPIAGKPWLDVFCPGCGKSRAIDLRTVDRHPLASVGTMVLGLRCSQCSGSVPTPKLVGLFALPPAIAAPARS